MSSLYHADIDSVKTAFSEVSMLTAGGITRASKNKQACFLSQFTRRAAKGAPFLVAFHMDVKMMLLLAG